MTIVVNPDSKDLEPREHHVPQDKHLLVHAGDRVEAGDPLCDGPLVPHDILAIKGEESLQAYLLHEVQSVYRSQNVGINDKHIETILAQMLRKVKVENPGDSSLLPSEVVDKFRFRDENQRLAKSVKIADVGDSDYSENQIVSREELNAKNEALEEGGKAPAKGRKPRPATASTLLLGITKAALRSESFISAASFQETTKVLTEAALSSAVDRLVGLKENVILGHLIPAGTGFKPHQALELAYHGQPIAEEVSPIRMPGTERPEPLRPALASLTDVDDDDDRPGVFAPGVVATATADVTDVASGGPEGDKADQTEQAGDAWQEAQTQES
jgi:DNA-directed RNA polymerase subunit beta'